MKKTINRSFSTWHDKYHKQVLINKTQKTTKNIKSYNMKSSNMIQFQVFNMRLYHRKYPKPLKYLRGLKFSYS